MIRKALVVLVGVGFAALLHGCYSADCLETGTCGVVAAGADEPSCDPSEGRIDDERCPGVFVSMLGSDDNTGTRDQPMRSMDAAIDRALLDTRRIYVCAEKFAESVTIPAGVEVWGGLDCMAGWAYVGDKRKTEIAAEANAIPLRFLAGAGRAVVADVHAEAAHATIPGGSSIAVLIETDAAVDLLRSKVVAGHGANGLDGSPGGALPAAAGDPGSPGADACTAASVQGGAGALNSCRGSDSVGGTGGIGGALTGGAGTDGTPAPSPNPAGFGLAGTGQMGPVLCSAGQPGAPGAPGAHGLGGRQKWGISELGLTLYPGEDGADGWPGQGGGGGGGSRAGSMVCGSALNGGASGGGGGAGGCGGAGGQGGGAGGASIGILSLSSGVTIRQTVVWTGRGGDGGNGGLGQLGGAGGAKGPRGVGVSPAPDGCEGGRGGNGGPGGNGGGGVGGPSIGILYHYGDSPLSDAEIRTGEAGKGGLGGDPNALGSAGEDGVRADAMGVPPQ